VHPIFGMSAKRTPPDDEILAMAAELRPFVKTGETVVPFIRRNQQRLLQLVEEESWATLARVMTALGMTYSSGKAWTARYISNEFDRATVPLKRRRGARTAVPTATPNPAPEPAMTTGQISPAQNARPEIPVERAPPVSGEQHGPASTLPIKRKFAPATVRRPEPPRILTEEETARQEALDERLFGKKS
jgi:hypothetical protein